MEFRFIHLFFWFWKRSDSSKIIKIHNFETNWRRKITPTLSSIYVLRFHSMIQRSKPLTLNNSADQWCNQIIHLEFSLIFRIDHHELPLQNLIFLTSFVSFLTLTVLLVLSTAVKFFLKGSERALGEENARAMYWVLVCACVTHK